MIRLSLQARVFLGLFFQFQFLHDPIKPRKIMAKNGHLQAGIKGEERVFNPQNLKPTIR